MIQFKNVHKHFKDLHVINGISLEIKKGEVVVVCGPSGSGKSTLIRMVFYSDEFFSEPALSVGDKVKSPAFGVGIVREIDGMALEIEFSDGKVRKLNAEYARLEKV